LEERPDLTRLESRRGQGHVHREDVVLADAPLVAARLAREVPAPNARYEAAVALSQSARVLLVQRSSAASLLVQRKPSAVQGVWFGRCASYLVATAGAQFTVAAHVASGVGRMPLSAEVFAMSAL